MFQVQYAHSVVVFDEELVVSAFQTSPPTDDTRTFDLVFDPVLDTDIERGTRNEDVLCRCS